MDLATAGAGRLSLLYRMEKFMPIEGSRSGRREPQAEILERRAANQ